MIFQETALTGSFVVDVERREDARGFFARTFCAREFDAQGLATEFVNTNLAFNHRRGTLRGMHYQRAPHEEVKLVRCTRGSVYDVIVDLRPNSPTLHRWVGVQLSAGNYRSLYVPQGFAHGYLTLEDDTEVSYQVSAFHAPDAEAGLRWDDPALAIEWPADVVIASDKDRSWPLLDPARRAVTE